MQPQNCIVNACRQPSYRTHCLFYFLYYACLGLFRPFIPSFLSSAGLDSHQIGNVFVLISLATLISAPSWGSSADKFGLRSKFLVGFPLIVLIDTPLADTIETRHFTNDCGFVGTNNLLAGKKNKR